MPLAQCLRESSSLISNLEGNGVDTRGGLIPGRKHAYSLTIIPTQPRLTGIPLRAVQFLVLNVLGSRYSELNCDNCSDVALR